MNIIRSMLDVMTGVSKSEKKFMIKISKAFSLFMGKANMRNLSRYANVSEKTIARNFVKFFDYTELNKRMIETYLPAEIEMTAVFDPTFLKKTGKKTYGVGPYWNGSRSIVEKGLEVGVVAAIDVKNREAYPLYAQQTPPSNELHKQGKNRTDAYLNAIKSSRSKFPAAIRYLVVDGGLVGRRFVVGVLKMELDCIGKLRLDANLRHRYNGPQKPKGRHRKYDEKFDKKDLSRFEKHEVPGEKNTFLYSNIMNSPSMKKNILVVCVVEVKNGVENVRAILFSTDLKLSAEKIYQYYLARPPIEAAFRGAKQYLGFSDCQSRNKDRLHAHFNHSLIALNEAKMQDYLLKKAAQKNKEAPLSIASYKRRNYNRMLAYSFFSMLASEPTLKKYIPQIEKLVEYGTIT